MFRPLISAPAAPSSSTEGVVAYLAVSFGLAWSVWAGGLFALGLRGAALLNGRGQATILTGSFAPAVAAAVVRRWITREGFADAGLRPNLRRAWRCYLLAVLGPAAAGAATVALAVALGVSRPDFSLARAQQALSLRDGGGGLGAFFVLAAWSLAAAVLSAPLLWGEEFGWRGYLQTRLPAGRPLAAAVVTGLIWGVWHYPLVLAGYGLFGEQTVAGLVLYPLVCVPLSAFLGWLNLKTGSVWAPSLAHAVHNNVTAHLLLMLFAGGPNVARVVLLLVPSYGALGAWLYWRSPGAGSARCSPAPVPAQRLP
jgi:membrane protease YdiL (CAAX protease family)